MSSEDDGPGTDDSVPQQHRAADPASRTICSVTARRRLEALSTARYYAIYANNFTALNPGGANYRTYRFLDQNHNGVVRRPGELGTLISSSGGSSTTIDPNLKQPYGDEFSGSLEHSVLGRVVGARRLRPQDQQERLRRRERRTARRRQTCR